MALWWIIYHVNCSHLVTFFFVILSYILHFQNTSHGFLLLVASIHHPVNLNTHANILVPSSVCNSLHKTILKTESTTATDTIYIILALRLILRTFLFTVTLAGQSYWLQKLPVQITSEVHSSWCLSFNLHCNFV